MILRDNECLYWNDKDGEHAVIVQNDAFPIDPRDEDECALEDHLVCWHNRYSLGDKHDYETPCDFAHALADSFGVKYTDEESPDTIMDRIAEQGYIVYLPVWAYEHSDISLCAGLRKYPYNDRWDSYRAGYIYMTRDDSLVMSAGRVGVSVDDYMRKDAPAFMQKDIEVYNEYLCGAVYCFTHYLRKADANGVLDECFEEYDSCGGFYGSDIDENCLRECADVPENAEVRKIDDIMERVVVLRGVS